MIICPSSFNPFIELHSFVVFWMSMSVILFAHDCLQKIGLFQKHLRTGLYLKLLPNARNTLQKWKWWITEKTQANQSKVKISIILYHTSVFPTHKIMCKCISSVSEIAKLSCSASYQQYLLRLEQDLLSLYNFYVCEFKKVSRRSSCWIILFYFSYPGLPLNRAAKQPLLLRSQATSGY